MHHLIFFFIEKFVFEFGSEKVREIFISIHRLLFDFWKKNAEYSMQNSHRFDLIRDPVHLILNIFENENILNVYAEVIDYN